MTCCYLIQSHNDPAQVLRLVEAIKRSSPGAEVLVVHDARRQPLDPAPFEKLPGVEVLVRRERVARGELSVLSPMFAAIEHLLGSRGGRPRSDFDWLVYLSGQDYPTRPLKDFEDSLATTKHQGFLTFWDVEGDRNPWRPRQARDRYFAQYRRLPDWTLRPLSAVRFLGKITPLRFHLHYGPFVGWRMRKTPFGEPFRCYGGWQWWTLSRPCVEYLRDFMASRPEIVGWFSRTMAPCESLVPTILANSGRFDLFPDNRRFVDFAGSRDGRPRTLHREDLPLIARGEFDFARKFDVAEDSEILDLLDREVLTLTP
jgi:hypothetical protein